MKAPAGLRAALALLVCAAAAAPLSVPGPAAAQGLQFEWSALERIGPRVVEFECPGVNLCVAVEQRDIDHVGQIVVASDPSSARSWRRTGRIPGTGASQLRDLGGLMRVTCPSVRLCVAIVDGHPRFQVYASRHPAGGARTFRLVAQFDRPDIAAHPWAVSCPSERFCAVLSGRLLVSATPARRGSWHRRPIPRRLRWVRSITCASERLCVAWRFHDPRAFLLDRPLSAPPAANWIEVALPPFAAQSGPMEDGIDGMVCAAPARCLVTTLFGQLVSSPNFVNRRSWTRISQPIGARRFDHPLGCRPALCFIEANDADVVLASTDPFAGRAEAWQAVRVPPEPDESAQPVWVDCPTARRCYALAYRSPGAGRPSYPLLLSATVTQAGARR